MGDIIDALEHNLKMRDEADDEIERLEAELAEAKEQIAKLLAEKAEK